MYLKDQEFWQYSPPSDCSWAWKKINSVKRKLKDGYAQNRWIHTKTGMYTIKSGYEWLKGSVPLSLLGLYGIK